MIDLNPVPTPKLSISRRTTKLLGRAREKSLRDKIVMGIRRDLDKMRREHEVRQHESLVVTSALLPLKARLSLGLTHSMRP